ncbi:hypothetical protein, partial [Paracraurococcus ruber]|uniref:hypothetical protein n=1 Tax=Paracraurococcus ruber TaxID=77675 RepID=UPI001960E31A
GVADDLGREAEARVGDAVGRHPASFAQPCRSGQGSPTWQCRRRPSAVKDVNAEVVFLKSAG